MSDAAPVTRRPIGGVLLWAAFILVHLWLVYLNLGPYFGNLGDVSVLYRAWAEQAIGGGPVVGLDGPLVYPVVALVPILAAAALGIELYPVTWLVMVTLLNLAAFALVAGRGTTPARALLGWWWVAFLLLLGPIALGRIDAVVAPIAIAAVSWVATRPQLATVLLTLGAWIKVWPAAIVAALVVASAARWRVAAAAVGTSLVVLLAALLLGSGANVLSFVTAQTGRGLQVEAPISTPWLWLATAGVGGALVYYDRGILTFQVAGQGVDVAAALMTPVLMLAVAAVAALGIVAVRRGVPGMVLLAPLSLAFVTALIAFNKVGSPQFITWLAAPVLLGLAASLSWGGVSFRAPAVLVLGLALLTQLIYPMFYDELLGLDPLMLLVLTVRNGLLLVLFFWGLAAVMQLIRGRVEERALSRE